MCGGPLGPPPPYSIPPRVGVPSPPPMPGSPSPLSRRQKASDSFHLASYSKMDGEEARPSAQTRFGGVCGFLQEQLPGGSVVATILFAWFRGLSRPLLRPPWCLLYYPPPPQKPAWGRPWTWATAGHASLSQNLTLHCRPAVRRWLHLRAHRAAESARTRPTEAVQGITSPRRREAQAPGRCFPSWDA